MKRMTTRRRKDPLAHAGDTPAGREIISALADLHKTLKSGAPLANHYVVNVREATIADPRQYDGAAVRETRRKLGVSQAVFAKLVGASLVLIQSWEQGRRFPRRNGLSPPRRDQS